MVDKPEKIPVENPHGIMVKMLNCILEVSLNSSCVIVVTFMLVPLEKYMNSLILLVMC